MRRYLFYSALAVAVLVLVFTAGVWVGTNQDPWSYFTDNQSARTDQQPQVEPETLDEPEGSATEGDNLEDDLTAGRETNGGEDESAESEPHRVDNPPDAVDPDETGKSETSTEEGEEDGVYAVSTAGRPEVGSGNAATDTINPFIVSTLDEESRTWWHHSLEESLSSPLIKKSKDSALNYTYSDPLPEFPYLLVGSVELPEIDPEDELILNAEHRTRVTVATTMFPELYCTVADGHFALHLTETEAELFRGDGLKLRVHSPAFSLANGERYAIVSKSSHTPLNIKLDRTEPFVLTVNVTPPEAVEQGVFVWTERQGAEEFGEDSVFMRSNVPESGRLHFVFSAPYGEVRVGASGERWHSGLPRRVRWAGEDKSRATINLELANDFCDRVTGTITQDMDAWKRDAAEHLEPVKAVRLAATHFGTVTYSDRDGRFEVWAPTASSQTLRQLIVTKHLYPTEVIPLEARAEGSPNVDYDVGGRDILGPWAVKLQRWTKLTIDWRADPEIENASLVPGSGATTNEVNDRRQQLYPVRWGERIFYCKSGVGERIHQVYFAEQRDWDNLEKLRFKDERLRELELESLEEVIEKRERALSKSLKRNQR